MTDYIISDQNFQIHCFLLLFWRVARISTDFLFKPAFSNNEMIVGTKKSALKTGRNFSHLCLFISQVWWIWSLSADFYFHRYFHWELIGRMILESWYSQYPCVLWGFETLFWSGVLKKKSDPEDLSKFLTWQVLAKTLASFKRKMLRFCRRKVMIFHKHFSKFLKKSKMIESNFILFLRKKILQEVLCGLFCCK